MTLMRLTLTCSSVHASMYTDLTTETPTPRLRWMPAQARQMKTPFETEAQPASAEEQSKHLLLGK